MVAPTPSTLRVAFSRSLNPLSFLRPSRSANWWSAAALRMLLRLDLLDPTATDAQVTSDVATAVADPANPNNVASSLLSGGVPTARY